jgi:Gas vesicle protein.
VLDRVLDKGVVVDAFARISLVGIEILTVEARVVVASVDTFLHYAEEIAKIEQAELTAGTEAAPAPEA